MTNGPPSPRFLAAHGLLSTRALTKIPTNLKANRYQKLGTAGTPLRSITEQALFVNARSIPIPVVVSGKTDILCRTVARISEEVADGHMNERTLLGNEIPTANDR